MYRRFFLGLVGMIMSIALCAAQREIRTVLPMHVQAPWWDLQRDHAALHTSSHANTEKWRLARMHVCAAQLKKMYSIRTNPEMNGVLAFIESDMCVARQGFILSK